MVKSVKYRASACYHWPLKALEFAPLGSTELTVSVISALSLNMNSTECALGPGKLDSADATSCCLQLKAGWCRKKSVFSLGNDPRALKQKVFYFALREQKVRKQLRGNWCFVSSWDGYSKRLSVLQI